MSEINVIEQRYVPVKPKVIANEQIEIYIPTAGYNYPGLATFDANGFIVDANGKVKLRRNNVRNISTFSIDKTTGVGTIIYDDGTTSTVNFPITTNEHFRRNNLMTVIDINPNSFIPDAKTGHWLAAFSSAVTGFDNDEFIVSFEEIGSEFYKTETDAIAIDRNGHYTIYDSIFKGEDGSVLVSIERDEDKNNFHGRLLLLGGSVFTDTQIVSINYNAKNSNFIVTKVDGTTEKIEAVSSDYLRNYVDQTLKRVYTAKGNITFMALPTSEELSTGKYTGYVYNIIDDFEADVRFDSTSYGKKFKAGTNVVVAETWPGVYQFDVLGATSGMIDMSDFISTSGGTIDGALIFDGIDDSIYSSIDANELKFHKGTKDISFNVDNITLYDSTDGYKYLSYPLKSGTLALTSDLDTKLDKNTDTSTFHQVYGKSADGTTQWMIGYSTGANGLTLAQRDNNGNIAVTYPNNDSSATSKAYVAEKFVARNTNASNIVYGKLAGAEAVYDVSQGVTPNTIARRTDYGGIRCVTQYQNDATTKEFVETNFVAKSTETLKIYGTDSQGNQTTWNFRNTNNTKNTVAGRDDNGNIQVGTAVNPTDAVNKQFAEGNFVTKITGTTSFQQVYTKASSGVQTMANMTADVAGSCLVQRTADSQINLPQIVPTQQYQAVHKAFVEDNFVAQAEYSATTGASGTDGSYHARVYGVNYAGVQETIPIGNQANNYSICWRDANANIYVGDPTQNLHCINRRYFEENSSAVYKHVITLQETTVGPSDVLKSMVIFSNKKTAYTSLTYDDMFNVISCYCEITATGSTQGTAMNTLRGFYDNGLQLHGQSSSTIGSVSYKSLVITNDTVTKV